MGLLDQFLGNNFADDADQHSAMRQGLLAAGFGLLGSKGSFSQAIGQAGQQGMGAYQGAQESMLNEKFKRGQINNMAQQEAERKLTVQKQMQAMAMAQQLMGGNAQTNAQTPAPMSQSVMFPPQANDARAGQMQTPPNGQQAGPGGQQASPGTFMSKLNEDQITGLIASGALPEKAYDIWKLTKMGEQMQPGYRRTVSGANEYLPSLPIGMDYKNGVASPVPGAAEATARSAGMTAGATEAAKAPYDLVAGFDPLTQTPIMSPKSQALGMPNPWAPQPAQPAQPAQTRAQAAQDAQARAQDAQTRVPPDVQQGRNAESLRIMQTELGKAKPEDKVFIQKEIDRLTATGSPTGVRGNAASAPAGFPTGPSQTAKSAAAATDDINKNWLTNSYTPTLTKGDSAKDMLNVVQTARLGLSTVGTTGLGKPMQLAFANVLAALGVPQAETQVSSAQIFQNAGAARINSVLNTAVGTQTNDDARRAEKTFAMLGNTPRANEFILDMAQAIAERDAKKAAYYKDALPIAQKQGDLQLVDRKWQQIEPSVWTLPSLKRWAK